MPEYAAVFKVIQLIDCNWGIHQSGRVSGNRNYPMHLPKFNNLDLTQQSFYLLFIRHVNFGIWASYCQSLQNISSL